MTSEQSTAPSYNTGGIELTACQLHEALLMAGTPELGVPFEDRGRVRIFQSETGHSGPGLYCECVDVEEEGCILLDGTSPAIASPAQAVDLGARPMETAPRDGTMVRLLVLFEEHATEDTAESAWTIGVCNDDHVGEDQRIGWQFAGWCWTHDHFTEGKGTPVGWLPLIDSQAVGNG